MDGRRMRTSDGRMAGAVVVRSAARQACTLPAMAQRPPGESRRRSTAVTRFNSINMTTKTIALTLAAITASILIVGCQSTKKDVPVSSSVTDVTATPSATPGYTPAPTPGPVGPAYASTYDVTPPTATAGTGSATSGNTYTVKRGDTLYGIAKNKYGDGKQWQKIVNANPGLNPGALKVGQTITLP